MEKKYGLVMVDTITINDTILYRIKALRDFDDVKAGDIGGYIQSEENLSHNGNCWIYEDAEVTGNAEVRGDAKVYGNVKVYDNAVVTNNAEVFGDAEVFGNARVFGDAEVRDNAKVYGNAKVYEYAKVYGKAEIFDNARVFGNAEVYGNAKIYGSARVFGNAEVYGNAKVYDDAEVSDKADIFNNADISSCNDYLYIKGLGSENRSTTMFKLKDGSIYVRCGCFHGTLEEFKSKVDETHGDNQYGKEYKAYIQVIKIHFGLI